MAKRQAVRKLTQKDVLVASRRRCCICFCLEDVDKDCDGQIAHLDRNPSNSSFDNLAFLCLRHHDKYDSKTSQSKGYQEEEVREYRNQLYARNPTFKATAQNSDENWATDADATQNTPYELVRQNYPEKYDYTLEPWRYSLWQVANEPEFFAYKAGNRADGVCLIERIDIPDGRIVVVCIQTPGNPGNSITNCVEELCFQVCERFNLPANKLVWIEHYDNDLIDEWKMVTFETCPPDGPFENPTWEKMTPARWKRLQLKPKKKLKRLPYSFSYESKVTKLFDWPVVNLYSFD